MGDLTYIQLTLFIIAGLGTGFVNVLAGGGSLVSIPIFMIMCGLPATVANGTNRVGVFMQSAISTLTFARSEKIDYKVGSWIIIPTLIGALAGALIAVEIGEKLMNQVILAVMFLMLLVIIFNPSSMLRENTQAPENRLQKIITAIVFVGVGFYGGFIQAGVGILFLVGQISLSRITLLQANAIKVLAVTLFSLPALLIFAYSDQVHWGYGIAMGIAQSVGAVLGARFALRYPKANVWIRYLLIIVIVLCILKLSGLVDQWL